MGRILIGLVLVGMVTLMGILGYTNLAGEHLTPRAMINKGVDSVKKANNLSSSEEQLLRLQLAIVDYITHNGIPPSSLAQLVPQYFDKVPLDPATSEPYEYVKTGGTYRLGAQVAATQVASKSNSGGSSVGAANMPVNVTDKDFVNPNLIPPDTFVYDSTGKRDPFMPFDFSGQNGADNATNPLERYTLTQLRLTAVLSDGNADATAIVEDETGKGYTVRNGTRMGNANGVVVAIERDNLKVLETKTDITGKETQNIFEMKIQRDQVELDKNKKGKRGKGVARLLPRR